LPNATAPKGISSGRSSGCVFVDKQGSVSSLVNFGVMREGDTLTLGTNINFVMNFDNNVAATGNRRLSHVIRRAKFIDEDDDGLFVTTRHLLADQDKVAIGTVTAEVLAGTLDARLAEKGIELESVNPKDVTLSKATDKSSSQLAVDMEITGHYSPPPYLDFAYMVQDSINRDTNNIRRGLREYNKKCRDQTKKVGNGYKEDDFNAVVSMYGAKLGPKKGINSMDNVYSTACSTELFVPQYFETSLKEVKARDASSVTELGIVVTSNDGILESWAVGPVAFVAGLIVLLIGLFVFRRAIGPRRVDKFSSSNKTEVVASGKMHCFGEVGDNLDDGSVDSAFYTESDSDMEETEKERRMRLKRKENANDQRFNSKNRVRSQLKNRAPSRKLLPSTSSRSKSRRRSSMREERKLLATSQGSDDTRESTSFSLGDEEEAKIKRGRKEKLLSSSSRKQRKKSDGHLTRGRKRQKGGDNAKAYEESRIL